MSDHQPTTVAAIQMCSTADLDENLATAAKLVHDAATHGAKLAILPENFAFMGFNDTDRLRYQEDIGQGNIQHFLAQVAKENHLWLVGGTIPIRSNEPKKVHATCLVYNDEGTMVARYDKIHLFDAKVAENEEYKESHTVKPGNSLTVLDTPSGKLGLAVCFDVRFPDLFTQLAKKGAEMIALPSAFTVPTGSAHWKILTRCRAIDTFCYLIGAGQGGDHANGRKTYGHSVIVDPWGKILAEKNDDQPGIIYADIDLTLVYACRQALPIS